MVGGDTVFTFNNNELVDGFNRNSFSGVRVDRNQISEAEDSTGGKKQRNRL